MGSSKTQSRVFSQSWTSQSSCRNKTKQFYHEFWSTICRRCNYVWSSIYRAWFGAKNEVSKIIIRENFAAKLRKCLVHILPLLTTIVLVSLNLSTFFIGRQYTGFDSSMWQSFDNLLLQVAAKLMVSIVQRIRTESDLTSQELCIVASLATILLDVLRRELLFGPSGLPLGILTAKTQFVDLTYIISPQFRSGISGFPRGKRWAIGLMTVLFALMAVLAGPSSALLIIPQMHTDWQMGGATVYFRGTEDSIWPSQLDGNWTGYYGCYPVTVENLLAGAGATSDVCIWAGYPPILSYFGSYQQLIYGVDPLIMHDYTVLREMRVGDGWAHGVDLVSAAVSLRLSLIWYTAMIDVYSVASYTASKFANIKDRVRDANVITMSSNAPVVHTDCNYYDSVIYNDMVNKTYYPLQDFDYPTVMDGIQYNTKTVDSYANSSNIATLWFGQTDLIPSGSQQIALTPNEMSSAYLNVQIPSSDLERGTLMACSVDARWVHADIKGLDGISIQTPVRYNSDFPEFTFKSKGYRRRVTLTTDWLYKLTPQTENATAYYTTLAILFEKIGLANAFDNNITSEALRTTIESVVSAMVSDAMSRATFSKLYLEGAFNIDIPNDESSVMKILYAMSEGKYNLYMASPTMNYTGVPMTTASWSTTVAGLGFRATTAPYYLAISVLLLHALFALCHIIWVFTQGETSTAWASLTDLVVLAIQSPPPPDPILQNTSAGIDKHDNYKECVRIQARKEIQTPNSNSTGNSDSSSQQNSTTTSGVEIVFGSSSSSSFTEVVARRKY